MYTFTYKFDTTDVVSFNSALEAIKFFDSKGWGFHNFIIKKGDEILDSDEFFDNVDVERMDKSA